MRYKYYTKKYIYYRNIKNTKNNCDLVCSKFDFKHQYNFNL